MAKLILVGGGSASGKTYVINEVVKIIGEENVVHFSIDDYYKDLTGLPFEERKRQNFDHPKAFDWKLMVEQLKELKNDHAIEKPIYDYVEHNRKKETRHVEPKKIIIVEGIMGLVNRNVRELGDLKIFVNASREKD